MGSLLSPPPPVERPPEVWAGILMSAATVPLQLLLLWLIFTQSPVSIERYRFYLVGITVSSLLPLHIHTRMSSSRTSSSPSSGASSWLRKAGCQTVHTWL